MSNEITNSIKPLRRENPRPRQTGGIQGGSRKTLAYRQQLQADPGEWFVWKDEAKTGGDTGQALRTLCGYATLTGVSRQTLAYQSTARMNQDGKWTVYVRYVGENQEFNHVGGDDKRNSALAPLAEWLVGSNESAN